MAKAKAAQAGRTTQGLRDILFDEIDELRGGDGDPTKSLAVANLAKQIINTAKVELDFHRVMQSADAQGTPIALGNIQLGTAASAARPATVR